MTPLAIFALGYLVTTTSTKEARDREEQTKREATAREERIRADGIKRDDLLQEQARREAKTARDEAFARERALRLEGYSREEAARRSSVEREARLRAEASIEAVQGRILERRLTIWNEIGPELETIRYDIAQASMRWWDNESMTQESLEKWERKVIELYVRFDFYLPYFSETTTSAFRRFYGSTRNTLEIIRNFQFSESLKEQRDQVLYDMGNDYVRLTEAVREDLRIPQRSRN
jgi:hypothetical protein